MIRRNGFLIEPYQKQERFSRHIQDFFEHRYFCSRKNINGVGTSGVHGRAWEKIKPREV